MMINKKLKRIISLMLISVLLFSDITYATSLTEKKKDVQNKINKTETNVANVKTQKSDVIKQIEALENSMAEIDNEIAKIDVKLNDVNKQMDKAQKELDEITRKKEKHYELLKLRMRDMYENSTISYLDMFLESKSFVELIDAMYNITLIMKKDNEVLDSIKKLEEEALKKKAEIEENKVEIELLKTKQETKKYAIQSNIDEQEKLKSQLVSTEKNYMNQLEALEKESQEISNLINGKTSTTATYSGGQFTWPVPGWTRVSSGFGYRAGFYLQDGSWNPAQNHTGIDIPATKGTPIVAAASGKVITAGWVKGYGYTVMIDHGSSLVTLYGHNSALVVSVGQQVTKGQQISKCGSTGYSSGNHCHFEVRKSGKAVSPYNYL